MRINMKQFVEFYIEWVLSFLFPSISLQFSPPPLSLSNTRPYSQRQKFIYMHVYRCIRKSEYAHRTDRGGGFQHYHNSSLTAVLCFTPLTFSYRSHAPFQPLYGHVNACREGLNSLNVAKILHDLLASYSKWFCFMGAWYDFWLCLC